MARPMNVSNPSVTMRLDPEAKAKLHLMAQADERSPSPWLRRALAALWTEHLEQLPRREATAARKQLDQLLS